jgi:hypothetical protein
VATLCVVAAGGLGCGGNAGPSEATSGAAPRSVRVAVSPVTAGKHRRFTVSITTVHATGVFGKTLRSYAADVHAVTPRSGCVNNRDRRFPDAPAGSRVRAVLDPARGEGGPEGWCRGRFGGTVRYSAAFACPPKGRCQPPPGFPSRTEVVGRFTVRVR